MTEEALHRWEQKVDKLTNEECWNWKATRNSRGYGELWVDGKSQKAHRLAYEHFVGPLNGLMCLHHCDNPSCVNPAHLFKGTQFDNMRDCRDKGRLVLNPNHEEDHPSAKLTRKLAEIIRQKHLLGTAIGQLARDYKVARCTIQKIIYFKTWRSPFSAKEARL